MGDHQAATASERASQGSTSGSSAIRTTPSHTAAKRHCAQEIPLQGGFERIISVRRNSRTGLRTIQAERIRQCYRAVIEAVGAGSARTGLDRGAGTALLLPNRRGYCTVTMAVIRLEGPDSITGTPPPIAPLGESRMKRLDIPSCGAVQASLSETDAVNAVFFPAIGTAFSAVGTVAVAPFRRRDDQPANRAIPAPGSASPSPPRNAFLQHRQAPSRRGIPITRRSAPGGIFAGQRNKA